ncbi:MAG: GTPase domain-containing protein [Promethearchaeota archaeon]
MIKKKIVFVGPPDVGKTTIQQVYFEHMSPTYLLENPLNPSRGVNSCVYSIFNTNLGVFDLAGQENKIWFSNKGKDIFNQSNVIICVFDIKNSLESIINFLLSIYKLKKELNLFSCRIIAFLHKIDLRSNSYVRHKLKDIQKFITLQHPQGKDFEIFETSIKKENFYNTFCIISKILNSIYDKNGIPIKKQDIQELKKELSIILESDNSVKNSISDLTYKLNLSSEESKNLLENLEKLRFVKNFDEYQLFELTERAYYFKIGLKKEINNVQNSYIKKTIEQFHIIFCLKESIG